MISNFLGCDSVSAFHGKGKTSVWKIAKKSEEYAATFRDMGTTISPSTEIQTKLCRFVCHLYGFEDCDEVNDVRYQLFKKGKCDEELLPPNHDSLEQHIKRANYQCYIWRHAEQAQMNLPCFSQYGWRLDNDGNVLCHWMNLPPAPDSVLEFVSCKCTKGCLNNRCSCVKATLPCTDLCKCNGCKNAARTTDEAEDTDNYNSEGSSSSSDDSEDELN